MILDQRIGLVVPFAAGIVRAEHGGILLRFPRNAQRQAGFGEAIERFGGVAGGLVLINHVLEADLRCGPLTRLFVEAANVHFLARQMIAHEVDLEPRVGGIFRLREATLHLAQGDQRLLGHLLVPLYIADLLVIAQRDQVIGVRRVLVTRVDRQEALRALDRFRIVPRHIVAESAHQLCAARPRRIGVLALHLVEQGGGKLWIATVEPLLGGRVKRFHVTRDIGGITRAAAAAAGTTGHESGNGAEGERGGDGLGVGCHGRAV